MKRTNCIAIILPALDEEKNLKWLLPQLTCKYQVIVVDNGSKDNSARVAENLGAHVIHCQKRGYGSAVKAGFEFLQTQGLPQATVIFDADGTSPIEEIDAIAKPVQAGTADLSIGQRVHQQKGAMPPHAKFGNWLQVQLIKLTTGFSYKDMGPLRALGPEAISRLQMEDRTWGWNVEMQVKAPMLGLKVVEREIVYFPRKYGHSKISGTLWGSLRAGGKILFAVAWYYLKALKMQTREQRFLAKTQRP